MDIVTLIVSLCIVAVVIKLFFTLAKKEMARTNAMVAELTNEQTEALQDNEVEVKDSNQKTFSWFQKGLIVSITEKGNNYKLVVLWYNTVMQNGNDIRSADIKISKGEFDAMGLKAGDYTTILIEPNKPKATIVSPQRC